MRRVVVVMGVAGSGKTTVGRALAKELGWTFIDADDLHPDANVDKMRHGIALTENDREPWLTRIRSAIDAADGDVVLACSALTAGFRRKLAATHQVRFVFLKTGFETARERVQRRAQHYFPPELVTSQFTTLEEPRDAIVINAEQDVNAIVGEIREQIVTSS